jgi:NitT/TauT family transport system permease protein/taurine transport system permease protein
MPFAVLVAIWSLVCWAFGVPSTTLPAPLAVLDSAGKLIRLGELPADAALTLKRFLVGAILAALIGVPFGVLLGASRTAAQMFAPFVRFVQSVPDVALLPLFVMWFGFGNTTIQVAILYTALVPIILNTMVGIQTIPTVYKDAVATMGGQSWRFFRDVWVPGAIPSIVVGIRLGLGYGWRILIIGEMLVGNGGLGFLIFDARRYFLLGQVITGMVVIGILYLILDRMVLVWLEDITVRRWGLERS